MAFFSWYFILFYAITFSCLLLIWRMVRTLPPRPRGWFWIPLVVLGITWVINVMSMQWAVLVGGMAWLLLILLPSLGLRRVQRLIYRQQYQVAYRWSQVLRLLHPFDGWWEQPEMIRALALAQQGDMAAGQRLLTRYRDGTNLIAQQAIAMHYAMRFDWEGLLLWLSQTTAELRDPLLTMYYCRALGETGQLHELLLSLTSAQSVLLQGGDRRNWHLVQLFTAAFCGEVKLVRQLTEGTLTMYPKAIQEFWLAIAHYAAGQQKLGQQTLERLSTHRDRNFQTAVNVRLANPPQPAQKLLRRDSYPLIAQLTRQIQQEAIEQHYQSLIDHRPGDRHRLSVNCVLVALNLVIFLVSLGLNRQMEPDLLLRWGSFIPDQVWHGEWWRILTAIFIHVGWAHLLTNMVTLSLLGGFAEKHLGHWRYLAIYLLSGLLAMVTLLGFVALAQDWQYETFPRWLTYLTAEIRYSYRQWVGASGAIMGMIGAIAVILFRGWRQIKSQLALKQLRLITIIILLQFALDLSSSNVSFYSHFLGFCWGSLLTIILTNNYPTTPSPNP